MVHAGNERHYNEGWVTLHTVFEDQAAVLTYVPTSKFDTTEGAMGPSMDLYVCVEIRHWL